MEIRKSDNTVEDYSEDKIRKGVYAAFESAGEECNEYKVSYILGSLSIYDNITSAEIRRQVEAALMSISKPAAKAYIQSYDKKTAEAVFVAKKKDFIEQYIAASNPATGSKYDANANVSMKNVVTMGQELYKFENIKQNRKMLFDRIAKLYSKKLAKQYIDDLESHILYKHDETAIPGQPYCVAITMYPFLVDGLTKLGGISTAPTDLKSFCGEFINLVYSISSQFAGACATPSFLLCMDYFIRKDFGENYLDRLNEIVENNTKQRTLEKVIENYFQQVVHSMNMPAGNRGYQTVFWNVGYFDKNYFDGVFGDFAFPDGTKPNWTTLNWLQKKFMKWFNKEREKYILTFPVETMAMLTDGHDVLDKEYANFTAEMWSEGHSFFVYLSDSADSLSSCCFDKNTRIMYSTLGSGIYEKAVPIKDAYEKHKDDTIEVLEYNPYTKTRQWSKAKFVKAESNNLYKITFNERADWTTITATCDHIFPISTSDGYKDVKVEDLKIGDKLLADESVWTLSENDFEKLIEIEITSIEKINESQEVYCIKMENEDSPYFVLANGIVSHNCRLRNSLKDMEDSEHNHTQHQFSMGTASVATGSKSVMTINLNRVIQNAIYKNYPDAIKGQIFSIKDHPEAYNYIIAEITEMTERVHKYQVAFNSIIKDFFESRMLPVYDAGFITLNKQYLTVGVNGLTDAAEFLGLEINDNEDYKELVNNVLETINIINKKDKTREHMFNTEFVPKP